MHANAASTVVSAPRASTAWFGVVSEGESLS